MGILITDHQNRFKISTEQIRKTAQVLLNALDRPDGELSILITDDDRIAEINQEYLNRTGSTNVISFSMIQGDYADVNPDAEMLGDVIISMETAEREAEDAGMRVEERFYELLVHGILHIFGYDHETPDADWQAMESKAGELMAILKETTSLDGDTH